MLKPPVNLLDVTITTGRLLLVPVSLEYKQDVFREFTSAVTKYMTPVPAKDISETENFINTSRQNMSQGKELVCFVLNQDTKEFLGAVGLHRIDTVAPELGCWVKLSAQGYRYGREATHALKQWADQHVQYDYLHYPVAAANTPSRKIPESLGGRVVREYNYTVGSGAEMPYMDYRIDK